MLRLRQLTINQFRSVVPGVSLHFNSQAILLGRNGTGKTTLLRIIEMCLSSETSRIREDFDINFEIDFEDENGKLCVAAHARRSKSEAPADLASGLGVPAPSKLRAEIALTLGGKEYVVNLDGINCRIRCDGEEVFAENRNYGILGIPVFQALLTLGQIVHDETFSAMTFAFFKNHFGLRRFDESLEVFDLMLGKEAGIADVRLTKSDNQLSGFGTFLPTRISHRIAEATSFDSPEQTISFLQNDLWFLSTVVQILGFKDAWLDVPLKRKDISEDSLLYGDFRFSFELSDGSIITHHSLSYGQKRLLAFLYYLECSPQCVVADELVNGLHHDWIEACLHQIGERQAFLSSQNPLLLDCLTFESEAEAKDTFIICDLDEERKMLWRNLTDEEASSFYKAYASGFQHVGEILRTKGLW